MSNEPQSDSNPSKIAASPRVVAVAVAVLAVVLIGAGGAFAQAAGYGFMGYRVVLYGDAELYVLNLADEDRYISVDGRPVQRVEAGNARLLPLVGGESVIEAMDGDGQPLQSWTVETDGSHILLNLDEESCLLVSKLFELAVPEEMRAEIATRIDSERILYTLDSSRVIWPRGYPGAVDTEGDEPIYSVEVIDCTLTDDKAFLQEYVVSRINDRMK